MKTKTFSKFLVATLSLLFVLSLVLAISGAWYKGEMAGRGTLLFDKGIIIEYSGFASNTTPEEEWTDSANINIFSSTSLVPGSNVNLSNCYINQASTSNEFFVRAKIEFDFYSSTAENAEPISASTLSSANFDAEDLISTSGVFASTWASSDDGWFYYVGAGSEITSLPTTATAIFANNAHFTIEGDGFDGSANSGFSGGYKISNLLSIEKFSINLVLDTIDASVASPASAGWEITLPQVISYYINQYTQSTETAFNTIKTFLLQATSNAGNSDVLGWFTSFENFKDNYDVDRGDVVYGSPYVANTKQILIAYLDSVNSYSYALTCDLVSKNNIYYVENAQVSAFTGGNPIASLSTSEVPEETADVTVDSTFVNGIINGTIVAGDPT